MFESGFRWAVAITRKTIAYFQGAITSMTPNGVRLMYRLNPGLSVSASETSAKDDSAIDSMYSARSRKPRTSPAPWETGLVVTVGKDCAHEIVLTAPSEVTTPTVFHPSCS